MTYLAFLLPLFLLLIPARPAAVTTWTEPWDTIAGVQARWTPVGDVTYTIPTPGTLDVVAQSGGLISLQKWDKRQPITVTGTVRAEPNPGSSTDAYWGGLTLYNNNGFDDNYGELATERNVPPWGGDHTPRVVSLTNNIGSALLVDAGSWVQHTFEIRWTAPGGGTWKYYVDGNLLQTKQHIGLGNDPNIFILCVSVGAGVPDDGSHAHCQFGPITVVGVQK